jgi:4-amino-4-deoxy-L-arabinose transferase-like glycosyltransferase
MRAQPELRLPVSWRTRAGHELWPAIILLLIITVAVRLIDLDRLPVTDELYTSLAARGWLQEGEPRIADGLYSRAKLYTLLLAGWFAGFGDSIVSARALSLVAGSLLVVAVFVWTRSVAGILPAWIAGLFMALEPLSVQVSQFARFYAMHALVFWLAAIGVYALASGRLARPRTKALVALATVLGLVVANHLQVLTQIGLVGLGFWLALAVGIPWLRSLDPQRRPIALAAVSGLGLITVALVFLTGAGENAWRGYRFAPLWNRQHYNEFWFYHVYFVERYPTLWSLTPLAILLALVHRPRVAVFCTCIFVVSFILLSFGGMKYPRYMYFIMPFLFVLWAIGLAKAFEYLYPWIRSATDRVVRRLLPYLPGAATRWAAIAAGLVFLIAANGGVVKALMLFAGAHLIATQEGLAVTSKLPRTDWALATPLLKPWTDKASVILTSRDMHFVYYIGDYDFVISRNRISDINGEDFSIDPRTGKPVVSSADSLNKILQCYSDGVILVETTHWRSPAAVTDEVADAIEAGTRSIVGVPPETGIKAFNWRRAADAPRPADCATLPPSRTG